MPAHQPLVWISSSNSRESCSSAAATFASVNSVEPSFRQSNSACVAATNSSDSAGSHSKLMLNVPRRGLPICGGAKERSVPTDTL